MTRHVLGSNLRPSWMRFAPASAKATVYVSQFSGNTVNDYARRNKKNAPPLCQVNDQTDVNGIGVDRSGNLWVPVGGEFTGVVDEFGPSCGSQLFSIQVANGQPAAIAFDDKTNVYVLNILDADFEGNIDVYVPGGTQPTTVLGDKESFRFFDEAIDASTNVYVAWANVYNEGHLDEFAGAADPVIHLPFEYGFPGGVALDTKGNLLVVDDDAILVDVLAPPYTGTPIATFPLKAASIPCRFTKPGAELYSRLRQQFGQRLPLRREPSGSDDLPLQFQQRHRPRRPERRDRDSARPLAGPGAPGADPHSWLTQLAHSSICMTRRTTGVIGPARRRPASSHHEARAGHSHPDLKRSGTCHISCRPRAYSAPPWPVRFSSVRRWSCSQPAPPLSSSIRELHNLLSRITARRMAPGALPHVTSRSTPRTQVPMSSLFARPMTRKICSWRPTPAARPGSP